ncbi:MAG: DUF4340 domain-containing protein [Anaerolineales bacterium]|nr:DUF4340 domain-containing protein [Anaerolineales bacterium]
MAGKTTSTKAGAKKTKPAARRTSAKKITAPVMTREESPAKKQGPVFRTGTLVAILILAALIAFAVYLNKQKESAPAEETPTVEPVALFAATEGSPSSIEVAPAEGEAVKIARNAENAWAIVLPNEVEADQGLSEAAASQVSALQVISPVEGEASIFGLENPAYTITVEFATGTKHTLEIGDATPTNSGYYVRLDNTRMLITDLSGIDALLQLQAFPPILVTPAPEVAPTP